METTIFAALIIIGLTFATLLGTICVLLTQIVRQHRQIRELVREYKIFQAAKAGDLSTVRSLKSVYQKPTILQEVTAAGEDSESAGVVVTQRG